MKSEFGVIDHVDRQDEPIAKTYDSRLKLLELYDKAGFTTFHITEHHSTPLGLAPSPIVFLAAASRITQHIRFAPLVLIATLYNPLRLAAEICMLDHLTKGRFEIGTGRGVSGVELGFFNVREQDAPGMYGEAMEVVMAALTKDVVDFHGKYFDFTNVPIELKPYQLPHPPLWYATNSAESAAKAARQNMNIVMLVYSAGGQSDRGLQGWVEQVAWREREENATGPALRASYIWRTQIGTRRSEERSGRENSTKPRLSVAEIQRQCDEP